MKTIVFRKFAFWALTAITLVLITGCNDPVSDYTPDPPPPDPFELYYWSTLSMSKDWYERNPSASEFIISTAGELAYLAKLVNTGKSFSGKTITLANDINLDGKEWVPIGYTGYYDGQERIYGFNGVFDGNGKTINGLYFRYINTTDNGFYSAGLFGYVANGTVKNLGVVNADVNGSGGDCHIVGIVVGVVGKGSVFNSYSSGTISGQGYIGGIVGSIDGGRIINCYSSSTVSSSSSFVGGVVGFAWLNATVANCYATGAISGSVAIGGVVGYTIGGGVANSYFTGIVSGSDAVGGVAGCALGKVNITNSYSIGTISNTSSSGYGFGGVVGVVSSGSRVANCYSISTINGSWKDVGGLVGLVSDYSAFDLNLDILTGGLVSKGSSTITNCAALNLRVNGSNPGRIAGTIQNSTLSGNVAFDSMNGYECSSLLYCSGWSNKGANNQDGADISAAAIRADGTIGGRFTSENGWTTENGKLPGLLGKTVELPEYLR
jgi:hypothetical protein